MSTASETGAASRSVESLENRKSLAIVVPVSVNSIATPRTINDIRSVMRGLKLDWQIVIVRNGPLKRHLAEYLDAICFSEASIHCVALASRCSERLAIAAGMESVAASGFVCIAADGRDNPAAISDLVRKWQSGADCVLTVRDTESDTSRRRRVIRAIYRAVNRRCNVPVIFNATDYCLLDHRVVDVLKTLPRDDRPLAQQTARLGFRRSLVGIEQTWHRKKTTTHRLSHHFRTLRDALLMHSRTPIRALYLMAASVLAAFTLATCGSLVAAFSGVPAMAIAVGLALTALLAMCPLSLSLIIVGESLHRLLQAGPSAPNFSVLRLKTQVCAVPPRTTACTLSEDQILAELDSIRTDFGSLANQSEWTQSDRLVRS